MLIIFKMTGILVLAVLTTLALLFVFRYLYFKRQLLGRLLNKLNEYSDSSYDGRHYAYHKVYSHYITKCASIALKWIQTLHVKIRQPGDSSNHECYKTTSKGFVQTRHFPIHIRNIVNKLKMKKSNNLANKAGLFAIGLGICSFLTIAITQPTLPIALRVDIVAISVAALFVGLFSLNPSKDYQPSSPKDSATNKNLSIVTPNYSNNDTGYHQPYAKPFHTFHMFLSLLRHIISYCKERINQSGKEPQKG